MTAPGTGPYWHCIVPRTAGNLLTNPSFEFGTAGWAGTGASVVLGSVSDAQAFGAWSLRATTIADGRGASASASVGSGTFYAASAFARIDGVSGGSVQLSFAGTTNRVPVGSTWQRVGVGTVATSATTFTLAVQAFGASGGTLYVDGAQVENGSVPSTYIDGDQAGCQWLGAPHASASVRSGQTRAGGSIVRLADVGMTIEESPGIGAPPFQTVMQPYALVDGSEFQRQRVAARSFSLVSQVIGTSWAGLHAARERIIDVLRIDQTPVPQPVTLLYAGAGGTAQIGGVWDGGLEFGEPDGFTEPGAVARFVAPDPYWYSLRQEGTTLAPYTVLGSVLMMTYRDPVGRWGTMGAGLTGPVGFQNVADINSINGTVFVTGNFTAIAGTASRFMAQWANGAWGTLIGGTINGSGSQILINPGGTLFVCGGFLEAGGTVGARYVARHVNNAWGTLIGGTANGHVNALAYNPITGGFYAGGSFNGIAGTAGGRFVAQWNGATWGTLNGGTVNDEVLDVLLVSGTLWAGGTFGSVAGVGPRNGMAYWDGAAWGTIAALSLNNFGAGAQINTLTSNLQQQVIAAGEAVNPYRVQPGGSTSLAGLDSGFVFDLVTTPDGAIWACGNGMQLFGNYSQPADLVRWNGYSWLPGDVILENGKSTTALHIDAAGTLYVGGAFVSVGTAASITTVVNRGAAAAFPTLRLRNLASGTARVFQLLNTTGGTQSGIWFNYVMAPGEQALLDLAPGERGFTSNVRGNILGAILGGSNLASWRLQPGTNTVSFFADNPSVEAALFWDIRNWSADAEQ